MGKVLKLQPSTRHTLPEPPAHLEEPEAAMWRAILTEYQFDATGELALLAEGLTSHMRARRCREEIAADGETVLDRFGHKVMHPLLPAERGARQAFVSAMKVLRLDVPAPPK
jgi:hypothetical protein